MEGRLPTGTVTFLFTDIVGSTSWWERAPIEMQTALAIHDELLREAIAANDGAIFTTGGDGAGAVFARAGQAVHAAIAFQQALREQAWPSPVRLEARVAIHTGEAEERDGDYFGPPLNRVARVLPLAGGGEVLVSSVTAGIVRSQLPEGVGLNDLGDWELRSLREPEHLFQLLCPGGAPARAPMATGISPLPGNLFQQPPRLIGRDAALEALVGQLGRASLVTLTGVGGVGKTSLALAAAHRVRNEQPDGVWVCELAEVFERANVSNAVAETMGLRPQAGTPASEVVVRALAAQRCLVLLDNCEHVLDEAGSLAASILARCPHVTVLATSREGLGVPGEHLVALPTLAPDAAVELFLARTGDRVGGFPADDRDLVGELCAQLDGLPLAVELAAGRAGSMPLPDLIARLGERFRLLRGQRQATERHQTLRATVAWSYELLSDPERRVFNRLSVFAGGFTLSGAEAVCADEELDALDVDDHVAALVDKSIVVPAPRGRYALLETLRQYGEERLDDAGEAVRCRALHAAYVERLVKDAHDGLLSVDERAWWRRLQDDWANVRSAFTWARQSGAVECAAAIATHLALAALLYETAEPYLWAEEAGTMAGAAASRQWSSVLAVMAWAAWDRGDLDLAAERGVASLEAEAEAGPNLDALAEFALMSVAMFRGDTVRVWEFLDRSEDRARREGPRAKEAIYSVSRSIGYLACLEDAPSAKAAADRSLALAQAAQHPLATGWALAHRALALEALGEVDEALEEARSAYELAVESGSAICRLSASRAMASVEVGRKRWLEAAIIVHAVLQTSRRTGSWMYATQTLRQLFDILVHAGRAPAAALLLGFYARSTAAGVPRAAAMVPVFRARLQEAVGPEQLATLMAQGEQLSVEAAILRAEEELSAAIAYWERPVT